MAALASHLDIRHPMGASPEKPPDTRNLYVGIVDRPIMHFGGSSLHFHYFWKPVSAAKPYCEDDAPPLLILLHHAVGESASWALFLSMTRGGGFQLEVTFGRSIPCRLEANSSRSKVTIGKLVHCLTTPPFLCDCPTYPKSSRSSLEMMPFSQLLLPVHMPSTVVIVPRMTS